MYNQVIWYLYTLRSDPLDNSVTSLVRGGLCLWSRKALSKDSEWVADTHWPGKTRGHHYGHKKSLPESKAGFDEHFSNLISVPVKLKTDIHLPSQVQYYPWRVYFQVYISLLFHSTLIYLVPDMSKVWFQWFIYMSPPKCLLWVPQSQYAPNLTKTFIYPLVK